MQMFSPLVLLLLVVEIQAVLASSSSAVDSYWLDKHTDCNIYSAYYGGYYIYASNSLASSFKRLLTLGDRPVYSERNYFNWESSFSGRYKSALWELTQAPGYDPHEFYIHNMEMDGEYLYADADKFDSMLGQRRRKVYTRELTYLRSNDTHSQYIWKLVRANDGRLHSYHIYNMRFLEPLYLHSTTKNGMRNVFTWEGESDSGQFSFQIVCRQGMLAI